MRGDDAYAILKKKMQDMQGEKIQESVNRYFDEHPVQAGATAEQVQQIEQNKKDVDSLKEDITSKADKTSLIKTDRKLDALWKLNQGISYEFQTDDTEAYQKTVPSGAKVANVKSIGGKTIVWNQLLDGLETETERTCENPNNYVPVSKTFENNYIPIVGHNYFVSFEIFMERTDTYFGIGVGEYKPGKKLNNKSNAWTKITRIVSPKKNSDYGYTFYIFINAEPRTMLAGESYKIRNVNVFDLTQMFGAGNEPSTVEEFEAMFPADYYPYNAGELMSSPVNEVMEQGKNLLDPETFEQNGVYNVTIGENLNWENIGKHANIPVKENTNYTVSFSDEMNHRFAVALADKNGIVTAGKYYSNSAKAQKYSILTPANTKTMYVSFLDNLEDGNLKVQVEESPSQTTYSPYHKTSHTIPSVILELDGYGDGIDDVCNYVDWENKKYHKRIGRYVVTGDEQFYSSQGYIGDNSSDAYMNMDIGQKQSTDAKLISNKLLYSKWCWSVDRAYGTICLNSTQIHIRILNSSLGITNEASPVEIQNATKKYCKNLHESGDPIIIYYELAEEKIIDISDIIGDTFQKPLEVEAGDTLMFKNSNGDNYRIPVSSTEEYLVSLAEVAK